MSKKGVLTIVIVLNALVFFSLARYTLAVKRNAGLYADSIVAANDTARLVLLNSLNDTVRAYQRLIVQTEIQRDSLDKELEERPVLRVQGEARIDTLRFVDTVTVGTESSEGRNFNWTGTDGPFRITASALIRADWSSTFSATVAQVDTIRIGLRVGCGEGRFVSNASILMTAPRPLSLVPGEILQAPNVCNPPSSFFSLNLGFKEIVLVSTSSIVLWELGKVLLGSL